MQVIEAQCASILVPHDHLHIGQMSMPRPVRPNTAQSAASPARRGPRRRRSSTPGRPSRTRSHLPPESLFPGARHGRSLPRRGELTSRTPTRHRAPNREPGRIPIPATEQPGNRRPRTGVPGNSGYAMPAACPASTTSRRYDLKRTCRLVTGRSHLPRSTWPNQARLPLLTVTHRYKRTHRLRLEQFRIADYARLISVWHSCPGTRISASSGLTSRA